MSRNNTNFVKNITYLIPKLVDNFYKASVRTMFTLGKSHTNLPYKTNSTSGRSFATYYNGTFVPQENTSANRAIKTAIHWKHPPIFAKLCPNCNKITCNNLRQTFCKYHPRTNKQFLEIKTQALKNPIFIGTTTHGTPTFKGFEKKLKVVVPLSTHDMEGNPQPKGVTYNVVLLKKPVVANGASVNKNVTRTAFLQEPKIQNRLNLYVKNNQNTKVRVKYSKIKPKALRYSHRYHKIKNSHYIKKPVITTSEIPNETNTVD